MIDKFTMIAAVILSPALLFKYVNNNQEFGDGLPPWSDAYMNRKSSYVNTDLFFKWFTESFLKHKSSGKVILQNSLQLSFTVSDCCSK
jgi:hypothetical protein